jgi:hypothetical protein
MDDVLRREIQFFEQGAEHGGMGLTETDVFGENCGVEQAFEAGFAEQIPDGAGMAEI